MKIADFRLDVVRTDSGKTPVINSTGKLKKAEHKLEVIMARFVGIILSTIVIGALSNVFGQTSNATISGSVVDQKGAVIPGATVTVKNVDTGFTRTVTTEADGKFQFSEIPIGGYEITVEAKGFAKLVRSGVGLLVNQVAVLDLDLRPGGVEEVVTITEDAPLLNSTTPEVATRFDERRLSELPIAPNRNVMNVLLSVPGVSQLGSGQTGFANGVSFSSNGGRLRSNNFMIDGQDVNDPSVAGGQIPLNNPDAFQEVRITTNQFLPEFGRNSGSVINFIGKSGTNDLHGSVFWFHNNKKLNSCTNLDKTNGNCNPDATTEAKKYAPFRLENQYGFTVGGPFMLPAFGEGGPRLWDGRNKTHFFVDYQKWTDRQLGAGFVLAGAPTAAGRQVLQSIVGSRPQVQALLQFVPAGAPNGTSKTFTVNGVTHTVELGDVVGTTAFSYDDNQGSFRIDHRINENNLIYGRYRWGNNETNGTGQATPPGLTTANTTKTSAAIIVWNSVFTSSINNELRLGYSRYDSDTNAVDPSSETIPSIEISELGMTGFNAAADRKAIGLAVNLPQFRINNTYQIQDSVSILSGDHSFKFGVDLKWLEVKSFFFPTVRGRLAYSTLNNFVNDIADLAATINRPLAGGDVIGFYEWNEWYLFAQDQWRIKPNFTLSYGVRYENSGDSFSYLKELNQRILAANGNNPGFVYDPVPKADTNNWMPRVGFNWNPRTSENGVIGFITGGDKLILRGGYARSYDANFINLNLNVFSSFPFVASITFGTAGQPSITNAFTSMQTLGAPNVSNPLLLTRTVVGGDFRAPSSDQFSLEMQRELTRDTVFKIGYVGTRGRGLFQTVDGNPTTVCAQPAPPTAAIVCPRVDTTRGVIRLRANMAESDYHSLQTSIEKRFSRGFSAGLHYTWSVFMDTASENFNPSTGEIAVAQDSFNLAGDRARSSYDRPHRLTGNFVYELPFYRDQRGFLGHVLGGWQVNSFFTVQSGAPFTVLNGADPANALSGISGLVGNAIRANYAPGVDLHGMSAADVRAMCTSVSNCSNLFTAVTRTERIGNIGRNTLRADGIENIDFGIIKNTRITETIRFQLRADMFNVLNHRNFGVPNSAINAGANFLNQWATNGGNRRIIVGGRLVF